MVLVTTRQLLVECSVDRSENCRSCSAQVAMSPLTSCLLLLIATVPCVRLEFDEEYEDYAEPSASQHVRQFRRPHRPHRGELDPQRFLKPPRPRHLIPEKLKELLGEHFNPRWMSITMPEILLEPPEKEISENRRQVAWLREQFQKINLTEELVGAGVPQDPEIVESISKWFFKRALCPLVYRWKDMSPYFWPRYIKHGECMEKHQLCSWPISMNCVPVGSTTLTVLRWQCRQRRKKGRGKRPGHDSSHPRNEKKKPRVKCDWYSIEYPVTSECMCAC